MLLLMLLLLSFIVTGGCGSSDISIPLLNSKNISKAFTITVALIFVPNLPDPLVSLPL